ncbi:MAG: glycine--tRNA ligase subunit beta [Fusobacteriaceae bacterium]|nr:glycine--tRNA ligase subunit beta [Fusobacteriaceae bacterium]
MRLLFELGMEELPARFLRDTLKNLKNSLTEKLQKERIEFENIKTYGTPRRLILDVTGISAMQKDLNTVNLGPAKNIAYDENGEISKAGLGFVKSQGLKIAEIEIIKTAKGEYIGFRKFVKGKGTKELLPELLKSLVLETEFPKSMRWSNKKIRFARPIQWFLAMLDDEIVKFEIEGIVSSNKSKGHRFFGKEFEISTIDEYFKKIRENNVIIDIDERKEMIKNSIEKCCIKDKEKVLIESALLEEVTNLVEYPFPIVGTFNSDFLEVPQEVLIISMEVHQRYFPILDINNKLLPKFIVIRNGIEDSSEVRKGNEKVLAARLADARFFYQEDLKNPLENNINKLKTVVFQKDLGTIYNKIERMEKIARFLIGKLELENYAKTIIRTVHLAKADLVSNMIGEKEFTKLQGFMGADYAIKSGEGIRVSKGIEEHYYPRYTGDRLPSDIEGTITGIVDRIDTLVGCFGVGVIPSGSKDPFALRRAALGIVNIILNSKLRISLKELVNETLNILGSDNVLKRNKDEVFKEIIDFFEQRAINIFSDMKYSKDVINSVLSVSCDDLVDEKEKINTLSVFLNNQDFISFLPTLKRVENISKDFIQISVDPSHFEKDIEKMLWKFTEELKYRASAFVKEAEYTDYFNEIIKSKSIIDRYFERVMVMADNEGVRNNRLSQIKILANIFATVANLNLIEDK